MAKTGKPPNPNAKQTVGIRVDPDTKLLMSVYGNSDYWRNVLKVMAETKAELDQGVIDPADFALIAGARTAQITGIPSESPPEKTDNENE